MSFNPALLDSIYEAAVVPELWSKVCDDLARVADGYSCSIININPVGGVKFVTSEVLADDMQRFAQSDIRSTLPGKQLEMMPFSFMRDVDLLSPEEIETDELKQKILAPIGLYWQMGDAILEPSGHLIVFDLLRKQDLGPFSSDSLDRMNALRSDLSRAVLLSSRLAFEQARTMASSLASLGIPACIIGDTGKILAANEDFEQLNLRIRIGADDQIRLADPSASGMLAETIQILKSGQKPGVQSIPVSATEIEPALILHLVPVRRAARDIFSRSAMILLVTPVGAVGPPDVRVLCGLFDLTPAEAKVARKLTVGTPLDLCAQQLGLTLETVRTYVKRIFVKTGTSRQAELVALLSGLGSIKI